MKPRRLRAFAHHGHTLLEMTISAALALIVVAGAVAAYRSQRAAFAHAADAARIEATGTNALILIGEQIQMAGFVPADSAGPADSPGNNGAATLFGCSSGRPVGTGGSVACESLASKSDGIAIRYVGDAQSTWLSSAGQVTDCLGQAVGVPGSIVVNRYHAKPSRSTGESELYCEGSGNAGTAQPLVEGVERLRLRYWLGGAAQPVDAAALAPDQWDSVAAVDLCVQVRGAAFLRRVRYIDCDGISSIASDGRARRAFWRHVALRNRMARSP